jgi:large subunit ribosomal protein L29
VIALKTKRYLEDIRGKTLDELADELTNAKKELFNLRFQNATNQLDNTSRIHDERKNLARIQTIITQKKMGIAE